MDDRIHFVMNRQSGDDLEMLRTLSWEEGTVACTRHTWVWTLYHQMTLRGQPVSMGYELAPDAINILHGEVARRLLNPSDLSRHYIIGIRADFRPFPYGRFEIVQNKCTAGGRRIYMPHMPQPGLVERSYKRNEVVNICFAGRARNFIDTEQMKNDLAAMNCRFVLKEEGQWHNMIDVDILLGIRSLSKEPYNDKPPTKLFNAWLAGIPFIGGFDSAYEQVGIPGENYIRVCSYEELMQTIDRLRSDRELYKQLVESGREAGRLYTPEKITDKWLVFLHDVALPDYHAWQKQGMGLQGKMMAKSGWYSLRENWIRKTVAKVRKTIG